MCRVKKKCLLGVCRVMQTVDDPGSKSNKTFRKPLSEPRKAIKPQESQGLSSKNIKAIKKTKNKTSLMDFDGFSSIRSLICSFSRFQVNFTSNSPHFKSPGFRDISVSSRLKRLWVMLCGLNKPYLSLDAWKLPKPGLLKPHGFSWI